MAALQARLVGLVIAASLLHVGTANDFVFRATVLDCENNPATNAYVSVYGCTDKAGTHDAATTAAESGVIEAVDPYTGVAGAPITGPMHCPSSWSPCGAPNTNGLRVNYCSTSSLNGCSLAVMKLDATTNTYVLDPSYNPQYDIFGGVSLQSYVRNTPHPANPTKFLFQTTRGPLSPYGGERLWCPCPFDVCSYTIFEFKPTPISCGIVPPVESPPPASPPEAYTSPSPYDSPSPYSSPYPSPYDSPSPYSSPSSSPYVPPSSYASPSPYHSPAASPYVSSPYPSPSASPSTCARKCPGLGKGYGSGKPVMVPHWQSGYAVMCALDKDASNAPSSLAYPTSVSFSSKQPMYPSTRALFPSANPNNWGWMMQWPKSYCHTGGSSSCGAVGGHIYASRKHMAGTVSAHMEAYPPPAGSPAGTKQYHLTVTVNVRPNRLRQLHVYFRCTKLAANAPAHFGNGWSNLNGVQRVTKTVRVVCPEADDPVLYTAIHVVLN